MKDLIKKLVEAWGPSGFEHQVRAIIEDEVRDLCDEMRVDSLGNLICRIGEKTDTNSRIMIAAHMDEIGLMVSHIDRDGFMRFSSIGGVFPINLNGSRVKFENGTIGVISTENTFRMSGDLPKVDAYYIDVSAGTVDGGNQNADIKVGDPAVFWRTMDENGDRLIAKSMDDRIGCVVAIEAMRHLKETGTPHEVYFIFTTQEEVGVRGARVSAYGVDPEIGIALDVTSTGDTPNAAPMAVKIGHGAAIKVKDALVVVSPEIRDWMIDTAQAHDIPYQLEVLLGGSTDAAAIQMARSGVAVGCISIPTRYIHTPSELLDVNDVKACVDLLVQLLANPVPDNIKHR